MTYIDAHCHLADRRFDQQRAQVLRRAELAGISRFIQGGVDPEDWLRQQRFADPRWCTAFGLHPWFVNREEDGRLEQALHLLQEQLPAANALGELGLDFAMRDRPLNKQLQQYYFEKQLQINRLLDKPLVLHVVRAHGAALNCLRPYRGSLRGIVHGFSGSWEVARDYIDLGLTLSIGGAVTREGFSKLKKCLKHIPGDRLVVESDAPDMAPVGYPRSLNEPEALLTVAEVIGGLRDEAPAEVLLRSAATLSSIFFPEPKDESGERVPGRKA